MGMRLCSTALAAICSVLWAADPILDYDYSNGTFECRGKTPPPHIQGETLLGEEKPGSIQLDGRRNFMVVPNGRDLHLTNGGTLFAVVRLAADKEHGMLFFKGNEYLLGCYRGNNLYFNMGVKPGENFGNAVYASGAPKGEWCSLAAVLQRNPSGTWTVLLYINGERKTSQTIRPEWRNPPPSTADLTIGKGWGGVWFLKGDLAVARIYTSALDDRQISELSRHFLPVPH
ncbi:MAG: LamG domain-containing protein [Victivallales bacterium]|nr:LamG domain-containing protein [Victivallales bacterium]